MQKWDESNIEANMNMVDMSFNLQPSFFLSCLSFAELSGTSIPLDPWGIFDQLTKRADQKRLANGSVPKDSAP